MISATNIQYQIIDDGTAVEEKIYELDNGIGALEIIAHEYFEDGEQEAFDKLTNIKGLESFRNTLSAIEFTTDAMRTRIKELTEGINKLMETAQEAAKLADSKTE